MLPALGASALLGAPDAQFGGEVPTDLRPEFNTRVAACYQVPSRAIARDLANGIRSEYAATPPTAVSCFENDFESCIAHLRLPVTHRRTTRTTNLLERLFVEERRMKITPNGFGEKLILKLDGSINELFSA